MKKQPEVTDRTRQALVGAFCSLYTQKPIEKITVQEITRLSGYNRSTFYQYFTDIYELLAYVENDVLAYAGARMEAASSGIHDMLAIYEEKGEYLNALLSEYGSNRFFERLKNEIPVDAYASALQKDHPAAPYVVEYHKSTMLSMFSLWQRRGCDLPPEELAKLMHGLYVNGLSSLNAE